MEYIPLDSIPHYTECEKIVSEMGYHLVELKIAPQGGVMQILAVITGKDASVNIGINDCSKVHRVLLEKLEAMLGTDNTYMELTSPGMERNIKNAAEFALFCGREIRVYDKSVTDWIGGKVLRADTESVTFEILDKEGSSSEKTVPYSDIAKAKFIHL